MARIRVLDELTASRIAAGEVVERPAAVIKELVENSLDAGATAVTVDIKGGGIQRIRVTDNGSGIDPQDIRMAFERHATSKIASGNELNDIATLGFRGEALPSIAAVSKVTLTSMSEDGDIGARIAVEGGTVKSVSQAGCPRGTTIIVEDLFFNTPARLKFLKRPQTEAALVCDTAAQLALSRPDIALRLVNDGKTVFQTPGDGRLTSAASAVLGAELTRGMAQVSGESGYVKLSGLVGVGDISRGNRNGQCIIVNGRTVRSEPVTRGLEAALRERVMTGRFPVCVLHITAPAESLDVNCHPNKLEVRFSDDSYVTQAIYDIVSATMAERDVQSLRRLVEPEERNEATQAAATPFETGIQTAPLPAISFGASSLYNLPVVVSDTRSAPVTGIRRESEPLVIPQTEPERLDFEILGQAYGAYLIIKTPRALVFVDQHAAHERILYDRFQAALGEGIASQKLLIGRVYDVSPRDKARILEHSGELYALGFEAEDFGPASVRVTAVPVIMGEPEIGAFLADYAEKLDELSRVSAADMRRERVIQMACKAAIKAGDPLGEADMRQLLKQLFTEGAVLTCPHGRPVMVEITQQELERRFKRIV